MLQEAAFFDQPSLRQQQQQPVPESLSSQVTVNLRNDSDDDDERNPNSREQPLVSSEQAQIQPELRQGLHVPPRTPRFDLFQPTTTTTTTLGRWSASSQNSGDVGSAQPRHGSNRPAAPTLGPSSDPLMEDTIETFSAADDDDAKAFGFNYSKFIQKTTTATPFRQSTQQQHASARASIAANERRRVSIHLVRHWDRILAMTILLATPGKSPTLTKVPPHCCTIISTLRRARL